MNVYDTANRLAKEIKESQEYVNYKTAKETIGLNSELNKKIKDFEQARYEVQILAMQTGKNDEEKLKKVQDMYAELILNEEVKKLFDSEMKFNILLADVNKIIGEAIKDVIK